MLKVGQFVLERVDAGGGGKETDMVFECAEVHQIAVESKSGDSITNGFLRSGRCLSNRSAQLP